MIGRRVVVGLAAASVWLAAGCRSDDRDDTASSTTTAESVVAAPDDSGRPSATAVTGSSPDSTTTTNGPISGPGSTLPDIGGDDGAEDDERWLVDTPGASSVADEGGVAVLQVDPRGTHEWVRAAIDAGHADDVSLVVRIETPEPVEGSLFVGLGDGEWADAAPYQQQTGVSVEYGFAALHDGEVTLIVADGADMTRVGPVLGPVLDAGGSALVRLQIVDDVAQVRVWSEAESEPSTWALRADLPPRGGGGSVHLSFRGAAGEQVAINEVRLESPAA